jgi:hypothetical protein
MAADTGHDEQDDHIDQAIDVIGGEDTEFYLTAQDAAASGAFGCATVILSCRYQDCGWGLFVGEMELWEFVTDARAHWESRHGPGSGSDDDDAKLDRSGVEQFGSSLGS